MPPSSVDEHADAGAVHVRTHRAAALDDVETAHGDVLADLRDELETQLLDRAAVDGGPQQRLDVGRALRQNDVGDAFDERAEVIVLRDEVGLRVDLEDDVPAGLRVAADRDAALGRNARGLLVGLRSARFTQPVGRGVDVAVRFDERLLAFHHAGAGALAQFLDQGGFDVHITQALSF